MKKNKIKGANWYKENLRKYQFGILMFNIIIISVAFLIFAGILSIVVEQRFFYDVRNQIIELNQHIDKTSYNQVIQDVIIDDPRITVVYYFTDPKDSSVEQFLNPEIIGLRTIGILDSDKVTNVKKIVEEEMLVFNQIEIENHTYMTFLSKKWYKATDNQLDKDVIVCYVKIYMNIDGEIAAKKELNTALVLCILLLLILGTVHSFLITRKTTAPLQ